MRLFGFEVRLLPADPPQPPHVQPADRVLSYTPEDRVLMAYGDARIVLAHLLREDGAAVGDAPALVATVSYLREGEYEPA